MQFFLLYIEPGSSSYLIQIIAAAAMGAAYYLKTSWWRIKDFFRKKEKDQ